MRGFVRIVAVLMWWASFLLPIQSTAGRSVTGGEAFVAMTILLFGLFPYSLLLVIPPASWLTNLLPLRETFRLIVRDKAPSDGGQFAFAFIVNLMAVGLFMGEVLKNATPFYRYPAAYVWLGSFLLLLGFYAPSLEGNSGRQFHRVPT